MKRAASRHNTVANAVLGWAFLGELEQVELLQHPAREKAPEDFAPGAAAGFKFAPQRLIGVELVHQPLRRPLFRRQAVIRLQERLRVL